LPGTFQRKTDFEEENQFTEYPQIVSLTDDIVYCPKCGTINSFNKSKSGRLLNHFCNRCSLRMNDFWDAYLEGHSRLFRCKKCGQSTFDESIYCVSCGEKQEEVYNKRASEISSARGEFESLEPDNYETAMPADFLFDCCTLRPGPSCLGGIIRYRLKRLPKKVKIILLSVIALILIAVFVFVILFGSELG